jgi:rfaE bifunctional protein nucleotidyltransferase chain/domain
MSIETVCNESARRITVGSVGSGTLNLTGQFPRRLVLACGCFDLLHIGHARLLKAARKLGDWLVVGLNSDESVRTLKGPLRPILPVAEREELLLQLRPVDQVIVFDEVVPETLIRNLKPAYYVKGAEYGVHDLPEGPLVEELGGQVIFFSMAPGRSTTATLARIEERCSL